MKNVMLVLAGIPFMIFGLAWAFVCDAFSRGMALYELFIGE